MEVSEDSSKVRRVEEEKTHLVLAVALHLVSVRAKYGHRLRGSYGRRTLGCWCSSYD